MVKSCHTEVDDVIDVTGFSRAYLAKIVLISPVKHEYTTVITTQETALQVQKQRIVASAALVQALGGGWDSSQHPTTQELQKLHLIPD